MRLSVIVFLMSSGCQMSTKTTFEKLVHIDVSQDVKELQKQKYLPWTKAWHGIKKICPDASYRAIENDQGLPFFESPMGIFVKTEVTIAGETLPMWRPVLNAANKAMKSERYCYKVKEFVNGRATGNMTDKWVEAATSTDINEALMRCLVKNFAMFGYGLHVFTGDDRPEVELIDSNQLSEITRFATDNNINLMDFMAAWGVNKVSDLWASNFDTAFEYLKSMANKQ